MSVPSTRWTQEMILSQTLAAYEVRRCRNTRPDTGESNLNGRKPSLKATC
jgi:hypothetical protein